jgi:hypothetical protein
MLAKLIHCFNNDGVALKVSERLDYPTICKVYTNCFLQNMLRTFVRETDVQNAQNETSADGYREFGLPVLGSIAKLRDSEWTRFP